MPGQVTLDLATKIVEPTQSIWAIFPGLARRFFNEFQTQNVVFLDMPAIDLTVQALAEDSVLRQRVAMSRAWRAYLRGSDPQIPSRLPSAYDILRDASTGAAVGNVRSLFSRAKRGDLVLVGKYDIYEPVLIGEIQSDFQPLDTIKISRYGEESIPVRKVRWLNSNTQRRFLSKDLSRRLSSRKAVVLVDKDRFGEEIFQAAYGDYVSRNLSRYVFEGSKYNNVATATIPGIDLITYFCAAFKAAKSNELQVFTSLSMHEGTRKYYDADMLASFEIDFRSPGEYTLYAKRVALAAVAALLVSATAGDISLPQAREAILVNSEGNSATSQVATTKGCPLMIEEKYRDIMNSMNADRYDEVCQKNKSAQLGVGLSVGVKKQVSP